MNLTQYRVDLHVHTVLSPCAGVEMIPPLIVQEALEQGIQVLAITDHNHTANIAAVQKAALGSGLIVLPGMEVQTEEEVHTLCLFDTLEQADAFQEFVDRHLPHIPNNPDFFGEQFIVDETGDFIRREERLLLSSLDCSLTDAFRQVESLGGLFIPAHVNRKAYGLIENLGLVPQDISIEALEISRHLSLAEARRAFPQILAYPLIQNGDVHYLDGFLGSTVFNVQKPSISEFKLALRGNDQRNYTISPK